MIFWARRPCESPVARVAGPSPSECAVLPDGANTSQRSPLRIRFASCRDTPDARFGSGGLGLPAAASPTTSGMSKDDCYTIALAATATTFTLTAAPSAGTLLAGDGNLTINEQGARTWGTKTC